MIHWYPLNGSTSTACDKPAGAPGSTDPVNPSINCPECCSLSRLYRPFVEPPSVTELMLGVCTRGSHRVDGKVFTLTGWKPCVQCSRIQHVLLKERLRYVDLLEEGSDLREDIKDLRTQVQKLQHWFQLSRTNRTLH